MKLKKKKKIFFDFFFFLKKKSRVGPEIFGSVGEPETQLFFFLALCFHQIGIENNSILAEFSPLRVFFSDLILIGFQPVSPCKGYSLF